MKPKLIIIFLLIVLIPLAGLLWLGVRVAHNEQEIVWRQFEELLEGRLSDTAVVIDRLMGERERDLLRITGLRSYDPSTIRALVRESPIIRQIFVLNAKGERVHPPVAGPLSQSERDFLQRAGQIWKDKQVFYRKAEEPTPQKATAKPPGGPLSQWAPSRFYEKKLSANHGWYTWYWGSGTNLVFWQRDKAGNVIGAELNRARLLADIIAELPDTDPLEPSLPFGQIRLMNMKGDTLYQWGPHDPLVKGIRPEEAPAGVAVGLRHPLSGWKLLYLIPRDEVNKSLGRGVMVNLAAGVAVLAIALIGLSVYFYRESAREIREAAQRVSFVNQVSHELKTPLTNIRMYAELLERDLPGDSEKAAQHLGVVVSECQRLSRLINNVLTFSRRQRDKLVLRMAPGSVDDLIASVIESFRPALEAKGVEIEFTGAASETVRFDTDTLEQILGNLFSNVEKYGAAGELMKVESRQEGDKTVITVADRGPGVPKAQRERIFDPFHRVSDKVTDGVAGTGIGLAIARDLARLHGGGLRLVPSEDGACFEVTLHTPTEA